jgi:hypothetical protein
MRATDCVGRYTPTRAITAVMKRQCGELVQLAWVIAVLLHKDSILKCCVGSLMTGAVRYTRYIAM